MCKKSFSRIGTSSIFHQLRVTKKKRFRAAVATEPFSFNLKLCFYRAIEKFVVNHYSNKYVLTSCAVQVDYCSRVRRC